MIMKTTTTLFLASTFASFVLPQAIDPTSVDQATKSKWCLDQKSSCPLLCTQIKGATAAPKENRCDSDTLVFSCICSNNQSPNSSEYSQTVPFYICQTAQNKCVDNCGGQAACQSSCRDDHPCGAQNPTRVTSTSSASSSSTGSATGTATGSDATATGSQAFTGFGGSSTATGTSDAARQVQTLAVGYGRIYGLATVLTGVFAGFMFLM